ncbi:Hypp5855 [Branchiostoma lanceolatum]|uniref:Hypp5855 protein n=1 Tax=Branchiostoma lanceolatum TaxID=7740 RepID=A0A8J9YRW7_BRALA|nr:Hypp5855 [Branchiostoma lanceolatum]
MMTGGYVAGILLFVVLQHTVTGAPSGANSELDVKQTARKPRVRYLPSPSGGAVGQGGGLPKPSVGQPSVQTIYSIIINIPDESPPGPASRKNRIRDLVPPFQYPVRGAVPSPGGARPPALPVHGTYQSLHLNQLHAPAPPPVPYPKYRTHHYPPGHATRAKRDTKSLEKTKDDSDKGSEEKIQQILENILSAPLATNDGAENKTTSLKPQNPEEFSPPDDLSSTPVPPVRLPIAVATLAPGVRRPQPRQRATTVGPPIGRAMGARRSYNGRVLVQGPPRTPVAAGVRQVWTPDNPPTQQPRWCGGTTFGEANLECLNWEFCMMAPGVQEGYCKQKCCLASHECGYPGAVCVGAQPAEEEDHSILGLCYGPPGNDVPRDQHDVTSKSQQP